jgi:murein DD-endopeptidase MepM/ murein hydrolase activator NlpD
MASTAAVTPDAGSQPLTSMDVLETPVTDAPVTSPYGWRVHPILKRRRFHKGVDYAAPEGTPVHAAAEGVVEAIGRHGHYGLYLRVRHGADVQTAYAHLAGFAPQLHVGSVVARGEVIGRVGRTGWATGPHLYYEVIIDGRRVDPCRPGLKVAVDLKAAQRDLDTRTADLRRGDS